MEYRTTGYSIKVVPNDKNNPPGKLADAELHFTGGDLEGLLQGMKLIGFGVWERRKRPVSPCRLRWRVWDEPGAQAVRE